MDRTQSSEADITISVRMRRVNFEALKEGVATKCVHLIEGPDGTFTLAVGRPANLPDQSVTVGVSTARCCVKAELR